MRVVKWMSPKVDHAPADGLAVGGDPPHEGEADPPDPDRERDGKLVGIVSDRDLKDVSPSRATTPRHLGASRGPRQAEDRRRDDEEARTVTPETPIEKAPRRSCSTNASRACPSWTRKGNLVGILTEGDVFRALVDITGAGKKRHARESRDPRPRGEHPRGRRRDPRAGRNDLLDPRRRRRKSRPESASSSCASRASIPTRSGPSS